MKPFALVALLLAVVVGSANAAQFTLSWKDNSNNEDGFTIERMGGTSTEFLPIANVGKDVTSYVDAGLPGNTEYTYRVCAFNAAGKSAYSNTATGTTPPPVPAAPTGSAVEGEPAYVPPVPVVTLAQGQSLMITAVP